MVALFLLVQIEAPLESSRRHFERRAVCPEIDTSLLKFCLQLLLGIAAEGIAH